MPSDDNFSIVGVWRDRKQLCSSTVKHAIGLKLEHELEFYGMAYQPYIKLDFRKKIAYGGFSQIQSHFELGHAEAVPIADMQKSPREVFYLPVLVVRKEHSTTTKVRAASAKSSTGISLNDTLLVRPTVHAPRLDVRLRFGAHCVALTTDVG